MASIARLDNRSPLHSGLLGAAFEASPQGLALVEDGTVLYVNPAFARLVGRAGDELEGATLAGVLPQLFQQAPESAAREIGHAGNDGAPLLEVSSSTITWEKRQLQVLALREASGHRERGTGELEEARDREIALRITRRLARDLSALLSAISVSSDVVAEGLEVGRRPRLHADKIRAASRRGEALVRQLLAIVLPYADGAVGGSLTRIDGSQHLPPEVPGPSAPGIQAVKKR